MLSNSEEKVGFRLQLLPEVINSRAFSFSLVNKDKMKQKERKHFYLSALKQAQRLQAEDSSTAIDAKTILLYQPVNLGFCGD